MFFYSATFLLIIASAIFYYRAGEFEGTSGLAWAGMSALISFAILRWLHGGALAILLGQVGLFAGITMYRARGK
jgi:hypothetical protein